MIPMPTTTMRRRPVSRPQVASAPIGANERSGAADFWSPFTGRQSCRRRRRRTPHSGHFVHVFAWALLAASCGVAPVASAFSAAAASFVGVASKGPPSTSVCGRRKRSWQDITSTVQRSSSRCFPSVSAVSDESSGGGGEVSPVAPLAPAETSSPPGSSGLGYRGHARRKPSNRRGNKQSRQPPRSGAVAKFNADLSRAAKGRGRDRVSPRDLERRVFDAERKAAAESSPGRPPRPNVASYTIVIDAYAKSIRVGHNKGGGGSGRRRRDGTGSFAGAGSGGAGSNNRYVRSIVRAARDVFAHMIALADEQDDAGDAAGAAEVRPSIITCNALLSAYARAGMAHDAEALLWSIQDGELGDAAARDVDSITYQNVMLAYARSGLEGGDVADKVEALLKEMEGKAAAEEGETGFEGDVRRRRRSKLAPNAFVYAAVMEGYSCLKATSGNRRKHRSLAPDKNRTVVDTDVAAKPAVGAQRAENLLKSLQTRFEASSDDSPSDDRLRPNAVQLNAVLTAWAESGSGTSGARSAEAVLEWARDVSSSPGRNDELRPGAVAHNAVLNAWARCAEIDEGAATRAEAILRRMEKASSDADGAGANVRPNVISYSSVINAYAKSARRDPRAARRAEEILTELEDAYLNSFGGGYGNGGSNDYVVKPNVRTYTSVIDAHANSRTESSASDAVRLLRRLQDLYDSSCRRGNPGSTGDLDLRPTVQTYSAALAALSKSDVWDAAEKAESLLMEMERDRRLPDPNVRCYNSVLDALAKKAADVEGAAVRAMELLERMEFLADRRTRRTTGDGDAEDGNDDGGGGRDGKGSGGDAAVRPNAFTYGAVMSAWARSNEPHRAEMAKALLEEMSELGEDDPSLRPGLYHYNWAINACTGHIAVGSSDILQPIGDDGREDESRRAFDIALETYQQVVGSGSGRRLDDGDGEEEEAETGGARPRRDPRLRPDSRTFAFFLKAVATNPTVDRNERGILAEEVFIRCQREGLVSREVTHQLMRACPQPETYMGLVGTFGRYPVEVDDLPDEWSRNTR